MIQLKTLQAEGFKNLWVNSVDFPKNGNILVMGLNESGKSTLFEAIYFALTSKLLISDQRGFIDGIAFDKNVARISLIFEKNGIPAKIQKKILRTNTGSTINAIFWKNFGTNEEKQIRGNRTEVENEIEEFLGFDDEVLRNSCFVEQKKGLEDFMTDSFKNRKKIIDKLLNLEHLTDLEEIYEKKKKKLKVADEYFEKSVENIDFKFKIKKLREKNEDISEFKEDHKNFKNIEDKSNQNLKELSKIIELSKESKNQIQEKNEKKNKVKSDKKILFEFQKNHKNIEDIKHKIEILDSKTKQHAENHEKLQNKLKHTKKELENGNKNNIQLKKVAENFINNQKKFKEFSNNEKIIKEIKSLQNQITDIKKDLEHKSKNKEEQKTNIIEFQKEMQQKIVDRVDNSISYLGKIKTDSKKIKQVNNKFEDIKEENAVFNINENFIKEIKKFEEILKDKKRKKESVETLIKDVKEIKEKRKKILELNQKLKISKKQIENQKNLIQLKKKFNKINEDLKENRKRIENNRNSISYKGELLKNNKITKRELLTGGKMSVKELEMSSKNLKNKAKVMNSNISVIESNILKKFSGRIKNSAFYKTYISKKQFLIISSSLSLLLLCGLILGIFVNPIIYSLIFISLLGFGINYAVFRQLGPFKKINDKIFPLLENIQTHLRFSPKLSDLSSVPSHYIDQTINIQEPNKKKILKTLNNYILKLEITNQNRVENKSESLTEYENLYFFRSKNDFSYKLYENVRVLKDDIKYNTRKIQDTNTSSKVKYDKLKEININIEKLKIQIEQLKEKNKNLLKKTGNIEKKLLKFPNNIQKKAKDFFHEKLSENKEDKAKIEINRTNLEKRIKEIEKKLVGKRDKNKNKNINKNINKNSLNEQQILKQKILKISGVISEIDSKIEDLNKKQKELIGKYEKFNLKDLNRDKINKKKDNIQNNLTQIHTTLKNSQIQINKKVKNLGFEFYQEFDLKNEEIVQETHKTVNFLTEKLNKLKKKIQKINTEKNFKSNLNIFQEIPELMKDSKKFSSQIKKFDSLNLNIKNIENDKKEKLKISDKKRNSELLEKFQTDYPKFEKFERDYNKLNEEKVKLESKSEDLKEQLKKFDKDKLLKKITEINKNIDEIKRNLDKINKEILSKKKKIKSIKRKIPEKFHNKDRLSNKLKILTEEIKKIEKEITQSETNFNTKFGNFKENFIKLEKEYNDIKPNNKAIKKNESIKSDPNWLKDLEFDKLKKFIKEKLKKTKEILDLIINNFNKKLIKKLNSEKLLKQEIKMLKANETQIMQQIDIIEGQFDKTIGHFDGEISNNNKRMKKITKKRRNERIIEKYTKKYPNLIEGYNSIHKNYLEHQKVEQILKEGATRISQKVLPKTIENLTRILPILTADRYKDCHITDDYEIKLFDSKRGDYVDKSLFSGGTNDQIALSLRLAFAMATMKNDSSNESFIFLDEPLGFFDDQRRNALIDFLTSGSISTKFAQRIVVSNYLQIKPYFDYVIEMENGKVLEQYHTQTLDSKQFELKSTTFQKEKFLKIEYYSHYIEDEVCTTIIELKNISKYSLHKIKLSLKEVNVFITFSSKYISEIEPRKKYMIELVYSSEIINFGKILINTHFLYKDGNNKERNMFNILDFIPPLSN